MPSSSSMAFTQVCANASFAALESREADIGGTAFAQGKVPSNKQIDVALNTALEWQYLNKPNDKLSADGKKLVADLRDVIEQSKLLLLSKNHGDLLQDFIWQTQKISAEDAPSVNSPLNKETAQQHGQQALEGLRTLGNLLITNGQFRKLCEYFQGERVCALKADFFDSE